MKTIYTTICCLMIITFSFSQTAQQHQPPPINNYPYSRGMFVDCTDDIIRDITHGNQLASMDNLKTFIRENYIDYVALYDLDQGKVIGNSNMESGLKNFLLQLKNQFPQLKIGIVGKKYNYTTRTKNLKVADYFPSNCISPSTLSAIQLDQLINSVQSADDLQQSETVKFFLRTTKFLKTIRSNQVGSCGSIVDVFYLEDPYWKSAGSLNLNSIKAKFDSYKNVLTVLQMLKCTCKNISIEAEFEPTDFYRLQGWTATDQIEQADPLIDRMMIPFYTNPYNASGAYDINCRLLHLLSDQFSRNGTTFYSGFSSQSTSFNFCNSSDLPAEHLGLYLSGNLGTPSGNMYSVEKGFLDKLNNPNYMCAGCSCFEFPENQYSLSNPTANQCAGSMWFVYSMMKNNNLFRKGNSDKLDEISIHTTTSTLEIELESEIPFIYELMDLEGRKIRSDEIDSNKKTIDISSFVNGLYILSLKSVDGRQLSRKIPVLHR